MFVSDKTELSANYADEVRNKKLFFDLCKNADRPKMVENSEMNYLLKYHQDCINENVVPLPILFKVRSKKLILKGYRLNQGLCLSMRHAFRLYPQLLREIKLENNGMSDHDLAQIIHGLSHLEELKRISIVNNIFLDESYEALAPILKRLVPNQLDNLRLIGVRTVPLITGKIMESLSDGCHLRRLSIVNGELSDITVRLMCNVIKKASFLIELDISANNMTSSRMLELSSVLAENRKL